MARVTIEDSLEQVPNRFALVLLTTQRAKQLLRGSRPLVLADNKEIVIALREIAAGKVRPSDPREPDVVMPRGPDKHTESKRGG